jgi:hypothetical protein
MSVISVIETDDWIADQLDVYGFFWGNRVG